MDNVFDELRRADAPEMFPDLSNPKDARSYRQSITRERKIDNLFSKAFSDLFEII